jgi:hypothetical protein
MVKKVRMPASYRHGDGNPIEKNAASSADEKLDSHQKPLPSERRTTQRFPIELPADLCMLEMRIPGTTVNISSGGLLMKCSHESVKLGRRVKVRITNWPNFGGENPGVVLVIDGAVVRDSTEYVAVRRIRYEFVVD